MMCTSALEAVGQLPASVLLTVVLVPNDAGIAQGGSVCGEIRLAPPDNFLRVNGGHPLDERGVFQLRLVGLDKQRHAGEHERF